MAITAVITDKESIRKTLSHLKKKRLQPFAHSPPEKNKIFLAESAPLSV